MQERQYTCDACKLEYKPESIVPTKRGEVYKRIMVRVYDVKHPKDECQVAIMYDSYIPGLDLCPRCEGTIKRFLNIQ